MVETSGRPKQWLIREQSDQAVSSGEVVKVDDSYVSHRGMRLRRVAASRYVTPLREGGSLPALMEADDDGLYVVKLRGAAQGAKTLVAELVAGEIGRMLGLQVPELVVVDLPMAMTLGEPDPEIKGPLDRSVGLNLGMDFLPGALPFDLAMREPIDPMMAANVVWFDALIANVDRTTRNPNMLRWHGDLWLIDHGASILPHHRWSDPKAEGRKPFPLVREHVLLPKAASIVEADRRLADRLTESDLWQVIGSIPDAWLEPDEGIGDAEAQREAYLTYFTSRLQAPRPFLAGAEEARTEVGVGAIDPERATRGRRVE
jgi:hypothetical protein